MRETTSMGSKFIAKIRWEIPSDGAWNNFLAHPLAHLPSTLPLYKHYIHRDGRLILCNVLLELN
jgi:hypothetical protein